MSYICICICVCIYVCVCVLEEEQEASTISQAALAIMDDVRPEISSLADILNMLGAFRADLPDRYYDGFLFCLILC